MAANTVNIQPYYGGGSIRIGPHRASLAEGHGRLCRLISRVLTPKQIAQLPAILLLDRFALLDRSTPEQITVIKLLNPQQLKSLPCILPRQYLYRQALLSGDEDLQGRLRGMGAQDMRVQEDDCAEEALWTSVKRKNSEQVRRILLQYGANPNYVYDNSSVLNQAIVNQDESSVEQLLLRGANPNSLDGILEPPLLAATRTGSRRALKLLMDAGANPSLCSGCADLPQTALYSRDNQTLKQLLDLGVPASHPGQNWSALGYAASKANLEAVKLLLQAGARVEMGGQERFSPLHSAVRSQNKEVVQLLIDAGAPLNTLNSDGMTAVRCAVAWKNSDILQMLLDAGADPQTGLGAAVISKQASMVRRLLAAGACPRLVTKQPEPFQDQSALDLALRINQSHIAEILSSSVR